MKRQVVDIGSPNGKNDSSPNDSKRMKLLNAEALMDGEENKDSNCRTFEEITPSVPHTVSLHDGSDKEANLLKVHGNGSIPANHDSQNGSLPPIHNHENVYISASDESVSDSPSLSSYSESQSMDSNKNVQISLNHDSEIEISPNQNGFSSDVENSSNGIVFNQNTENNSTLIINDENILSSTLDQNEFVLQQNQLKEGDITHNESRVTSYEAKASDSSEPSNSYTESPKIMGPFPVNKYSSHNSKDDDESPFSYQSEASEIDNPSCEHHENVSENSDESNTKGKISPDRLSDSFDIDNIMLCQLEATKLVGHAEMVTCIAADENIILTSSEDTTIKVWNVEDKKEIINLAGHTEAVTAVILLNRNQSKNLSLKLGFSVSSRVAVSASLDCHIKLWSVFEGIELLSIYSFNAITCMDYLESENCVVLGSESGKIEVRNLVTKKIVTFLQAHYDSVSSIKVEGFNIYSASSDGTIKVWLFEDNEVCPVYSRKRREICPDKRKFKPAEWKSLAVSDNMIFLGDHTNSIKLLDYRIGRLHLFRNQLEDSGNCECVAAKYGILLSAFYDAASDTGGVNVWRIPDMSYVCTLTGEVQVIWSLDMLKIGNKLRIISGGNQLIAWDFEFSKPPKEKPLDSFYVCEVDGIGNEVYENPVSIPTEKPVEKSALPNEEESVKSSRNWCTVM